MLTLTAAVQRGTWAQGGVSVGRSAALNGTVAALNAWLTASTLVYVPDADVSGVDAVEVGLLSSSVVALLLTRVAVRIDAGQRAPALCPREPALCPQ